jgi:hypothetical protein
LNLSLDNNFLAETRSVYQNILDEKKNLDGHGLNMITASGIILAFLLGIQEFLSKTSNQNTELFLPATEYIIISMFFSITVFTIRHYRFVLSPDTFFIKKNKFDDSYLDRDKIDTFLKMDKKELDVFFISEYLICNGKNTRNNSKKSQLILISQIYLILGIIFTIYPILIPYLYILYNVVNQVINIISNIL